MINRYRVIEQSFDVAIVLSERLPHFRRSNGHATPRMHVGDQLVPVNSQGFLGFAMSLLVIACRPPSGLRCGTQERAAKICLADPTAVSVARAVARWDGNVALQRWGCGRCRSADAGGRGYRFTARRSSSFLRFSRNIIRCERDILLLRPPFIDPARDSFHDHRIVSSGKVRQECAIRKYLLRYASLSREIEKERKREKKRERDRHVSRTNSACSRFFVKRSGKTTSVMQGGSACSR